MEAYMIRSVLVFFVLFCLLPGATVALAAEPAERVYDFGPQEIEGKKRFPSITPMQVRKDVRFSRLFRLKRHLLGDVLRRTAHDRALR
ncbi:MAG: hypothetical protein CMH54_11190 [Myxococcales bacterium]|nr:hypothetical protein [Myxococcales bacterium]